MAGEFEDKVVVVSGGSRGIGRGIAAAFAKEGARTVLAASSQQNLDAAAEGIARDAKQRPDVCARPTRSSRTRPTMRRSGRCARDLSSTSPAAQ